MFMFKELLVMSDICNIKDKMGRTILHTAATQGRNIPVLVPDVFLCFSTEKKTFQLLRFSINV